jgi:hypothetical protein
MSTRKVPNSRAKRGSGRAAIPAYVLRNAKLIGRDEAGRNVISLSIRDCLTAQSVAANDGDSVQSRSPIRAFVPEAGEVESARAA